MVLGVLESVVIQVAVVVELVGVFEIYIRIRQVFGLLHLSILCVLVVLVCIVVVLDGEVVVVDICYDLKIFEHHV